MAETTMIAWDEYERLTALGNVVYDRLGIYKADGLLAWINRALTDNESLRVRVKELEEHMVHVPGWDPSHREIL